MPRKTLYAYQDKTKAKLDHLVELCILEKIDGVLEWISPMSFVPKPDGDVRTVADLNYLNKHVECSVHPFPTPCNIVAMIPCTSKYFAGKPLATFITEWGCY